MTNVIHPERDAPVDHMKLHKDVIWGIRILAGLVIIGFLAGVWATTLADDVQTNTKALENKATVEQLAAVARTLERIEGKIDKQATEQKTVSDTVIRLETKVEALEKEGS